MLGNWVPSTEVHMSALYALLLKFAGCAHIADVLTSEFWLVDQVSSGAIAVATGRLKEEYI